MGGASGTLTGTAAIALTVLADADGNGMPDDWEIAHGLDAQRDDSREGLDGDSLLNIEEYLLGALAVSGTGPAWARARR